MQEVAHKIHIKKNGTQYDVNLYDNKFPSPDTFFPVKVGGTTYYIPATSYSGAAAGGSTPLRIKKGGTTYQIIKKAECNINIPTYANQKIVVEVTSSITGGKATYTNTVVVPFGSTFTAKVQSTNSQYNAGSMTSVSSGTITKKNINLTASPATIAIPTGSITINKDTTSFSVPNVINRIKVSGKNADGTLRVTYLSVPASHTFQVTYKKTSGFKHSISHLYINDTEVCIQQGVNIQATVQWGPSINT